LIGQAPTTIVVLQIFETDGIFFVTNCSKEYRSVIALYKLVYHRSRSAESVATQCFTKISSSHVIMQDPGRQTERDR
jgi:hypothetical protein